MGEGKKVKKMDEEERREEGQTDLRMVNKRKKERTGISEKGKERRKHEKEKNVR